MTPRTYFAARLVLTAALIAGLPGSAGAQALDLDRATVADLNAAFDKGTLTSEKLVHLSLARIDAYDRKGPALRAVIT
ncbi:MAG: amidase, partial [Acidobacteriota bacterium]|nr:amidase [Acidobacteriota bacterium]